ncbi:hypothetical protein EYF80_050753 [Liparis tanakae]|uniref:Uncharacterized protein n=1 Tax=Liparis tanakae TaxID=230148 RepID=A0A4Z2FE91_9TELE|nr:hypothetical protein EYF80_050753 [Liparis tanakae]
MNLIHSEGRRDFNAGEHKACRFSIKNPPGWGLYLNAIALADRHPEGCGRRRDESKRVQQREVRAVYLAEEEEEEEEEEA